MLEIEDRALEQAAVIAANRLYARTGEVANTVMVHPAMLPDGPYETNVRIIGHFVRLQFRANPWVARGHVWVGEEKDEGSRMKDKTEEANETTAVQAQGRLF